MGERRGALGIRPVDGGVGQGFGKATQEDQGSGVGGQDILQNRRLSGGVDFELCERLGEVCRKTVEFCVGTPLPSGSARWPLRK